MFHITVAPVARHRALSSLPLRRQRTETEIVLPSCSETEPEHPKLDSDTQPSKQHLLYWESGGLQSTLQVQISTYQATHPGSPGDFGSGRVECWRNERPLGQSLHLLQPPHPEVLAQIRLQLVAPLRIEALR